MCIAIYKPEGVVLSKETLEICFKANSDGAGYAYVEAGALHVKKGFFTFAAFWDEFQKDETKQAAIHFRIKTHGKINADMCHPFSVTSNLAFIHNGVISGLSDIDKSDTYLFNEEVVQPLVAQYGRRAIHNPVIKDLIEERIGYSKLVFLDASGRYEIYNEVKGYWDSGAWFSNTSYKVTKPIYNYSNGYRTNQDDFCDDLPRAIVPSPKATTYYLDKRGIGEDIHQNDFARVKYDHRGLTKDEIVEVIYISKDAACTVKTLSGDFIYSFSGAYLESWNEFQEVGLGNAPKAN
jgi:hypothetical protein